jgi:hypothetical protein
MASYGDRIAEPDPADVPAARPGHSSTLAVPRARCLPGCARQIARAQRLAVLSQPRRATSACTRVRLRAVRRRDSVYARLPPRLPPSPCAFVSLAIARTSCIKSSRAVRARCACGSHASSCASVYVNNSPHLE